MLLPIVFTLIVSTCARLHTNAPHPGNSRSLSDKYIVKLKGDVHTYAEAQLKASLSSPPDHHFSMNGFRGFAGSLTADELARLETEHMVDYVEKDGIMHKTGLVQQENATWGLSRISSHEPGGEIYIYDDSAGEGACAYSIDTGIDTTHPDFESRATFLVDLTEEQNNLDGDGHGTHTAGTIGSKTYGVAKKSRLYAIKVLDAYGYGTVSDIIAGFQYAARDSQNRTAECPKGHVANISLGGSRRKTINDAVRALVMSGVFVAVSAGNAGTFAEDYSPASEPTVCTVGAVQSNDTLAYFSNYGDLVDILAPGVNVTSTSLNGTTETLSGTSMSSPHVAGLGAYLLSLGADVGTLCDRVKELALVNVISGVHNNTVNLLAFNGVVNL
ncbi:subtilisin-like protease Pr1A [Paraphoma chrysanthemicola]|nr:subtilisin-like protease Pr1A [Paraphoma chrysanthemicola]